jgi:hypothetical protein
MPSPTSPSPGFALLWSQNLGAGVRGLELAREKQWVLTWDQANWLHLFGQTGQRQGQIQAEGAIAAATCAEDGSAFAIAHSQVHIAWLNPDLSRRWQQTLLAPVGALAMDSLGNYVAVADQRGAVHVIDSAGKTVSQFQVPRPLQNMAFVSAAPWLVASADFGLVGALDLSGKWQWRDSPVSHVGGLSVNGDGSQLLLACFSEGLRRYGADGKNLGPLSVADACRLVVQSYDGSRILVADLGQRLHLVDANGTPLASHVSPQPVAAIAIGARGAFVTVATQHEVACLQISE